MVDASGTGASEAQDAQASDVPKHKSHESSHPDHVETATAPDILNLGILSGRSLLRRADTREGVGSYSSSIWISGAAQAQGGEDDVFSSPPEVENVSENSSPFRLHLPDIRGQWDPHGVLRRRLEIYQSFRASPEHMSDLGPINDTLFEDDESQLHGEYNIKTVPTVKCDLCHQKCCINSEVYQCRQCVAQICRECVEDKLAREQTQGIAWKWRGDYHLPFKQAYLHRKDRGPGIFGQGSWIGAVQVPGLDAVTPVKLRMPPNSKTSAKKFKEFRSPTPNSGNDNKTSRDILFSKPKGQVNRITALPIRNTQDQRDQVQKQTMKSSTREKLDWIRDAAARAVPGSVPVALRNVEIGAGVAGQQRPLRSQPGPATPSISPTQIHHPPTPLSSDSTLPDESVVMMADSNKSTTESPGKQPDREQTSEFSSTLAEGTESRSATGKSNSPIDFSKRTYDVLPPPLKPTIPSTPQAQAKVAELSTDPPRPPTRGPTLGSFPPAKPIERQHQMLKQAPQDHLSQQLLQQAGSISHASQPPSVPSAPQAATGYAAPYSPHPFPYQYLNQTPDRYQPTPYVLPHPQPHPNQPVAFQAPASAYLPQTPSYNPETQPQTKPRRSRALPAYEYRPRTGPGSVSPAPSTHPHHRLPNQPFPGPLTVTNPATRDFVLPATPPGAHCEFAGAIRTTDALHRRLTPEALIAVDRATGCYYQLPVVLPCGGPMHVSREQVAAAAAAAEAEAEAERKRAGQQGLGPGSVKRKRDDGDGDGDGDEHGVGGGGGSGDEKGPGKQAKMQN